MYLLRRVIHSLLLLAVSITVSAQGLHFRSSLNADSLDKRSLRDEWTAVPGQGLQVPGMALAEIGTPLHIVGDDPVFAARGFVDSTWMSLGASIDSVIPGSRIHWVRYHVLAAQELKGIPLTLSVGAKSDFEVFLNGRSVVRSPALIQVGATAGLPSSDSLLLTSVPVMFLCDGSLEVIAIRVQMEAGRSLGTSALGCSLHMADTAYEMHRSLMHFGVFVGINIIILILALVIWASERRDRSWLLLALLSLVSALDTFCDVGAGMGALGFAATAEDMLHLLRALIVPWPLYLLIRVLGELRGDLSQRKARRYVIAATVLMVICASFGFGELFGVVDVRDGLTVADGSTGLIITVIALALVFGGIVIWFAVEVIRLAIRLLRSKGYARWVGGGALASSLLALILKFVGAVSSTGLSSWLSVIADYCSYVAVPVSVAVYLAIRSAHHNKLVARQRDELDEEVKERTAELRAEKERSDELLLNILPAEVAEELKRTGEAEAKHFDQASVLFTDFKGFTSMTEQVSAGDLLQELNTCFKAFDDIIGARGIEKIKTIGDAYMCVGGLPDPTTSSPVDVVHAALEMQAFMIARKVERDAQNKPAFEMRVGIHTGPVVAGIVGVKKFQYDIWGDAVNTASRMESSSEVGQVNISESTYTLVKNAPGLAFVPRGKVQAKGKGELEMYFVSPG